MNLYERLYEKVCKLSGFREGWPFQGRDLLVRGLCAEIEEQTLVVADLMTKVERLEKAAAINDGYKSDDVAEWRDSADDEHSDDVEDGETPESNRRVAVDFETSRRGFFDMKELRERVQAAVAFAKKSGFVVDPGKVVPTFTAHDARCVRKHIFKYDIPPGVVEVPAPPGTTCRLKCASISPDGTIHYEQVKNSVTVTDAPACSGGCGKTNEYQAVGWTCYECRGGGR